MRFTERFLVVLTLISLLLRYWGLKDGPTMELIAFPMLALYYLIAGPLAARGLGVRYILAGLAGGLILAYCIISCMLYTLTWLPRQYMLENCGILLSILMITSAIGRRRHPESARWLLLRPAILLAAALLIALLPLPDIAAIHH